MSKKYYKRLICIIKPYTAVEVLGLILTILFVFATNLSPMISKILIDDSIDNLQNYSDKKLLIVMLSFFVVCMLQPILGYLKDVIFVKITQRITYKVRKDMYDKLLKIDNSYFYNKGKGEVISYILNDCAILGDFISNFFIVYIKNIFSIFIIIIAMIYLSLNLTIVIIIAMLLLILIFNKFSKQFRALSLSNQENYDKLCTEINESLEMLDTIKYFNLESFFKHRFNNINDNNKCHNIKIQKKQLTFNNLVNGGIIIILCLIYLVGIFEVRRDVIKLGSVIALGNYFQMIISPVLELVNNKIDIEKIIPIIDRIEKFLSINKTEKLFEINSNNLNGDIKIENLSFSYDKDKDILKNVNMDIKRNSFNAIIGNSGVGKSTLIGLILGLNKAKKGNVFIGGININKINKNILFNNIAYVPQSVKLFNASIKDNILCFNNKNEDKMLKLCKELKIDEFVNNMDNKYDTLVTENLNISGGQKQLIGIARALIRKPKILICDEPTSALDSFNRENVLNILKKESQKCTVIFISHNKEDILKADFIYSIEKGKIEKFEEVKNGFYN